MHVPIFRIFTVVSSECISVELNFIFLFQESKFKDTGVITPEEVSKPNQHICTIFLPVNDPEYQIFNQEMAKYQQGHSLTFILLSFPKIAIYL